MAVFMSPQGATLGRMEAGGGSSSEVESEATRWTGGRLARPLGLLLVG